MADPLFLAEVSVVASDEDMTVVGLPGDRTIEVPPGRSLTLPGHESEPREQIFVPRKPRPPIRTYGVVDKPLPTLDDELIDRLGVGEPVVVEIAATEQIDLSNFRPLAEQAYEHDRALVIVARSVDG